MSDWRKHFEHGDRVALKPGQAVFRRGDAVTSVYLVQTGMVSLERVLPNGDILVLNRARAGDLLAEASLFAKSYHCDAITQEAGHVVAVRRSPLIERLENAPKSLLGLLGDKSREIQRLRSQIEILRLRRVADRLGAWLALNGTPEKGQWAQVAEAIGVSAPALYRELARRRGQKDGSRQKAP